MKLRKEWGCSLETNTDTGGLIYQLMPKLMEAIGPISKDRKNPVGFKYRGIEDALNAIHPELVKLQLTTSIRCYDLRSETNTEDGTKKRFVYRTLLMMDVKFTATDGSSVTNTAAGEGIDTAGDKATNKAMAAAFKYACFLGLCIPIEDGTLPDPDATGRKIETPAEPIAPVIPVLPQVVPTLPAVPAGSAAPDAGPKVSEQVRNQIFELMRTMEMPPEVQSQVVAKHGAATIHELSAVQADILLTKLKQIDFERQAEKRF